LIGVLAKPGQAAAVEEFFELFKTPWEFYRAGRQYEVVVATTADLPAIAVPALLVYSAEATGCDARHRLTLGARHQGGFLADRDGQSLPIYGGLATFTDAGDAVPCLASSAGIAGLRVEHATSTIIRIGYDLFTEIEYLLSVGQPAGNAHAPTLDLHIRMLRDWILSAGIPVLEIPPVPAGHAFAVCLTHDIDFIGIRQHRFDHTMWGFLYRSTLGAVRDLVRRRISVRRLSRMWRAAASLPFVYLGWAKDFWEPFEWFLRVEKALPATYFLIPFKGRSGQKVPGRHASRRATAYDVDDLARQAVTLMEAGCELGVHGIDAWHSAALGRDELARLAVITGASNIGIRMHWLLQDADSAGVLDRAGYAYDASAGYNDTIGYRSGTTQVFRPLGTARLLELPLHIQDGALFYPQKLDLSEADAEQRCRLLVANSRRLGGVLTLLWHDRSHGPERFWGGFYTNLVDLLKSELPWFGTAGQVVSWFEKRRNVRFEQVQTGDGTRTSLRYDGEPIAPPLVVKVHIPTDDRYAGRSTRADFSWDGARPVDVDSPRPFINPQQAHSLS
jgi:hypothetical protein